MKGLFPQHLCGNVLESGGLNSVFKFSFLASLPGFKLAFCFQTSSETVLILARGPGPGQGLGPGAGAESRARAGSGTGSGTESGVRTGAGAGAERGARAGSGTGSGTGNREWGRERERNREQNWERDQEWGDQKRLRAEVLGLAHRARLQTFSELVEAWVCGRRAFSAHLRVCGGGVASEGW